jgi:hypothetical protein
MTPRSDGIGRPPTLLALHRYRRDLSNSPISLAPSPALPKMSIARIRVLVATAALAALPFGSGAQTPTRTPGRFKISEIFAPAAVSGNSQFHILANVGNPGYQALIYTNITGITTSKADTLWKSTSGAAVVYDADGLHVFVVDAGGLLRHRLRTPAGAWQDWDVITGGGDIKGRPAAAIWKGKIYAFVTGSDGVVWYTTGNKRTFGGTRFTRIDNLPTMESPSAMSDTRRMVVLGINPATGYPHFRLITGDAWDGKLYGLYVDPANAPMGSLMLAPGRDANSIFLASIIPVPADRVIVAEVPWSSESVPTDYGSTEQLEAFIIGPPAIARGNVGNLTMVVRGRLDPSLFIREQVGGAWGNFRKIVIPK